MWCLKKMNERGKSESLSPYVARSYEAQSSHTLLLQGLAFVQGLPMVMMGFSKSASVHPAMTSKRHGMSLNDRPM